MGPHGLVIGATGSGKSELLRTLVLGLAMTHSPEILNFVLVDFKGGATFAGMAGMPHVSAIITNLADELTLVDRMQDALSGEMTRRQELLRASGNYASLRDYEKDRTSGDRPDLVRRCRACSSSATSSANCFPPSRSSSTCSSRSGASAGRSASTCCSPRSGSRRAGCAGSTATCPTGSACARSRPASPAASSAWATRTSCRPSPVSGSSGPTSRRCCGSRRRTSPGSRGSLRRLPVAGSAPPGARHCRSCPVRWCRASRSRRPPRPARWRSRLPPCRRRSARSSTSRWPR